MYKYSLALQKPAAPDIIVIPVSWKTAFQYTTDAPNRPRVEFSLDISLVPSYSYTPRFRICRAYLFI